MFFLILSLNLTWLSREVVSTYSRQPCRVGISSTTCSPANQIKTQPATVRKRAVRSSYTAIWAPLRATRQGLHGVSCIEVTCISEGTWPLIGEDETAQP
ncbi:uncharacterized protein BDZ99DRAFT_206307 [Mytilinidion resinicola]|uniref:Secreted protein n=1 Tax=Mytilinidion resinicola TaxID=574789 RepID=A0A6A6Y148_9PEZI|nr:uncharacterized protein BDZ99DRAFT_206307 [Mytilinidion resinicola]KAF2802531.1 hypothetical protein BDZ99DRAFT_206307 [Mytilinidion resinicola]